MYQHRPRALLANIPAAYIYLYKLKCQLPYFDRHPDPHRDLRMTSASPNTSEGEELGRGGVEKARPRIPLHIERPRGSVFIIGMVM